LAAERTEEEKNALETQMILERQQAAGERRQLRLTLALAAAAGIVILLIAYLMWIRMRHERALRQASDHFETHARVISAVREGVLLVNDRGMIDFANASLLQLFGRTLEELQGASLEVLSLSREILEGVAEEGAGGLPEGAREIHVHDGKGKPIAMLVTSSRLVLSKRMLWVFVLQDVTELRRLEREVLSQATSERDQLSSEVHEGIAQDLFGITLLLQGVGPESTPDTPELNFIVECINRVLERVRALARGLSPIQMAGGSLPLALSRFAASLAAEQAIDVRCHGELEGLHLSLAQSDHLYRIAQECLRNAAAHPDCRRIGFEFLLTQESLVLTTAAQGVALSRRHREEERGWGTIAYLARVIGGTARIEELASGGTRSIVSIPRNNLAAGLDEEAPPLDNASAT